ncbi:SigB/SigF/SigG family RNA polymerase sigma factor [Baekduia sp. Peel2402]|uniref:SigB/SigF/SigG family RNA polymerase sigma factor n=1 Tax=Baekduia sp. Peel2402 TaxID=3458296 RepID=UPI00403EF39C
MATAYAPAPPRDAPGDARLLRRFAMTRDQQMREQLVVRYLPLARYAASHYVRHSEPFDDLLQVASVGLLKSIDRFDPSNGATFSSFALPTMLGELRRHFRDRGWTVRPPRTLQEHALRVERAADDLQRLSGRSPTVDELVEATGLSQESVLEARQAAAAHSMTSLSARIGDGDDAGELGDLIGVEDDGFARADDRLTVDALLATLTAREREILRLRMEEDLTQSEIGQQVGLSQMHVSRLLREILEKLHMAAVHHARDPERVFG